MNAGKNKKYQYLRNQFERFIFVTRSLYSSCIVISFNERPTPGSAAPPQNHPQPGQDRLNNQHLLRPKTAAAVASAAPFVGRAGARPLPQPPLSPTQPSHFGRALTDHHFNPARPLPTTTTCRTNGRYPHHTTSLTSTTTSLQPRSDRLRVCPPNAWVSRATAKPPTSWARPAE
jgi:hypothetical protein